MNVTSPSLSNTAPTLPDVVNTPTGPQEAPHVQCYACGVYTHIADVHPFGSLDGHVLSWVCNDCRQEAEGRLLPKRSTPPSKYSVDLMTILKAARLAHRGYGRSADDVMNRALDLYEQHAGNTTVRA